MGRGLRRAVGPLTSTAWDKKKILSRAYWKFCVGYRGGGAGRWGRNVELISLAQISAASLRKEPPYREEANAFSMRLFSAADSGKAMEILDAGWRTFNGGQGTPQRRSALEKGNAQFSARISRANDSRREKKWAWFLTA